MTTVLIDTDSGNLHSAEKAFRRMARETGGDAIVVTSDPDTVRKASRVILPGDGAFPACADALMRDRAALHEALLEAVETRAVPYRRRRSSARSLAHSTPATDGRTDRARS